MRAPRRQTTCSHAHTHPPMLLQRNPMPVSPSSVLRPRPSTLYRLRANPLEGASARASDAFAAYRNRQVHSLSGGRFTKRTHRECRRAQRIVSTPSFEGNHQRFSHEGLSCVIHPSLRNPFAISDIPSLEASSLTRRGDGVQSRASDTTRHRRICLANGRGRARTVPSLGIVRVGGRRRSDFLLVRSKVHSGAGAVSDVFSGSAGGRQ